MKGITFNFEQPELFDKLTFPEMRIWYVHAMASVERLKQEGEDVSMLEARLLNFGHSEDFQNRQVTRVLTLTYMMLDDEIAIADVVRYTKYSKV